MTTKEKALLSICMIVKNEATILERCLKSITPVADEIIIVDTGSQDDTVTIAQKNGAQVFYREWQNDFAEARNYSIGKANCPWILWLDADDYIPPLSLPKINELKKEKNDKVFSMIVKNQKPDGTGTQFYQARMFPNHSQIYFERPIHEQIMPSALKLGLILEKTTVVIEHYGYENPQQMKAKAQRNVVLLEKMMKKNTRDPFLLIEIGDSYAVMEDQEQAKIWYQKIISIPEYGKRFPVLVSQAYMGLGNILNKEEQFTQALANFLKARTLCPERTDVRYCLAVTQEMLGEKKEALGELMHLVDMEYKTLAVGIDYRQTKIKAYLRIFRLVLELERFDDLTHLCTKALKNCEDTPEIQNMAGLAYFHLDQLIPALHCYEKSINLRKAGNVDAYIGLCMIYSRAGKHNLVIETLKAQYPMLSSNPRFWAFCEIITIDLAHAEIPQSVTPEMIDHEKDYLQRMYQKKFGQVPPGYTHFH